MTGMRTRTEVRVRTDWLSVCGLRCLLEVLAPRDPRRGTTRRLERGQVSRVHPLLSATAAAKPELAKAESNAPSLRNGRKNCRVRKPGYASRDALTASASCRPSLGMA